MDLKYITKAKLTENRANIMLNYVGLNSSINNDGNPTDIDLKVSNELVDVQYSGNFNRYGDIRIDLFSAFQWDDKKVREFTLNYKEQWLTKIKNEMIKSIKNQKNIANGSKINFDIVFFDFMKKKSSNLNIIDKKDGKYINHENELLGVLYYIYDEKIEEKIEDFSKQKISKIVFVSTLAVLNEIGFSSNNFDEIWNTKNFQVNSKKKNNLSDNFESAFLAINLSKLLKNNPTLAKEYSNREDFKSNFKNDFNNIVNEKEKINQLISNNGQVLKQDNKPKVHNSRFNI